VLQLCNAGKILASNLVRFWKHSAHAKLLQRPPPDRISPRQAAILGQGYQPAADLGLLSAEVVQLFSEEDDCEGHVQEFLQATFAARPVATLAQLLVWLQQRPELLRFPEVAAGKLAPDECDFRDQSAYCFLWMAISKGMRRWQQQWQQRQQQQQQQQQEKRQ
jgi:hypothetical protein